jgi:hypothetical protein
MEEQKDESIYSKMGKDKMHSRNNEGGKVIQNEEANEIF